MGAAFGRIDVVAERIDIRVVALVVLYCHFDLDAVFVAFTVDNFIVDHIPVLVQEGHIFLQAAFKQEDMVLLMRVFFPFIVEDHPDALVQEGQLAQSVPQGFMAVYGCFGKDGRICLEADFRAMSGRIAAANDLERFHRVAAVFKTDKENFTVMIDADFQPFAQRVDNGSADPVQTARDLVCPAAELAAGMQHGKDGFNGGFAGLDVFPGRHASAVILNDDDVVLVHRDRNGCRIVGHGFVNAVVHNFPDQVMKAFLRGGRDVHARTLADCFQPVQDLDIRVIIGVIFHPEIEFFLFFRHLFSDFFAHCIPFCLALTVPLIIVYSSAPLFFSSGGISVAVIRHWVPRIICTSFLCRF